MSTDYKDKNKKAIQMLKLLNTHDPKVNRGNLFFKYCKSLDLPVTHIRKKLDVDIRLCDIESLNIYD